MPSISGRPRSRMTASIGSDPGSRDRLVAAAHRIDGKAALLEMIRDHLPHGAVIFDQQHPHSALAPARPVRRMPYYRRKTDEVADCAGVRTWSATAGILSASGTRAIFNSASAVSRDVAQSMSRGVAAGAAALLGGCALYHPLPLARGPDLAGGLSALRTEVPALRPGGPSRRIATDAPLDCR